MSEQFLPSEIRSLLICRKQQEGYPVTSFHGQIIPSPGGQQDLPAISRKLAAYFSLEIDQLLQITGETFAAEHKPWIREFLS